jgi:hypothetical protein
VIRHAEKPLVGDGLTAAGELHARKYVRYFENYRLRGRRIHLDYLYVATDKKESKRPRLTMIPLSKALKLPINVTYTDKQERELVDSLKPIARGKHILICWRHGDIPNLVAAFGADQMALVPGGVWPSDQYNWVMQICFDRNGRLIPDLTGRVVEKLPAL